jgi:flagellar hook-associated protein FlgK
MERENLNLQKTLNEKEHKDDDIIGALADRINELSEKIESQNKEIAKLK